MHDMVTDGDYWDRFKDSYHHYRNKFKNAQSTVETLKQMKEREDRMKQEQRAREIEEDWSEEDQQYEEKWKRFKDSDIFQEREEVMKTLKTAERILEEQLAKVDADTVKDLCSFLSVEEIDVAKEYMKASNEFKHFLVKFGKAWTAFEKPASDATDTSTTTANPYTV